MIDVLSLRLDQHIPVVDGLLRKKASELQIGQRGN